MKNSPTKEENKLVLKLAQMRFLSTSIVAHILLILSLGGVVLFKGTQQKDAFEGNIGSSLLADTPTDYFDAESVPEEFQEPAMEPPSSHDSSAGSAGAITLLTTSTSNFTMNSTNSEQLPGTAFRGSGRLMSVSPSGSLGHPTGGKASMSGTLFGVKVATKRLGVLLDISFSTHGFIDVALEEIERSFPDAIIVLAPGCGIQSSAEGKVIPGTQYLSDINKYMMSGAKGQSATFLQKLMENNKGFDRFWKKGNRERRMYVLHSERGGSKGEFLIFSSQYGLRFLEKEGVDTIYWMADFMDDIQKNEIEALTRRFKSKQIRVIQHDLDDHPAPPLRLMLATETGGAVIQGKKAGGHQVKNGNQKKN